MYIYIYIYIITYITYYDVTESLTKCYSLGLI